MNKKIVLYIVVPCYNEEEIITESMRIMNEKLDSLMQNHKISTSSRIIFVNDGSRDSTFSILKQNKNKHNTIISLSINKGHQNALWAGFEYCDGKCDCVISLDCDLQDDINLIDEFLQKFSCGYEVIYGVRNNRDSDTLFKRKSAEMFYDFLAFLGVNIIKNHADYRLISKRVLSRLLEFREVNLFLRGIIPTIGFKSCNVYYTRVARVAGESKYPLFKMLSFALDGITNFSIKPLRLLSVLGGGICIISVIVGLWAVIAYLNGRTVYGWTSTVVPLYLLGGIQMLGLGIVGEYIGKIYIEIKNRPKYFIDEIIE